MDVFCWTSCAKCVSHSKKISRFMAAMRMKHGLEYEKIESTLCYLNELFFIYSTKTKHFLSNVFSFISLWHPMQSDFEEIEFCNQKYWRFYLREREKKQPNNCFVWVCEFVISCRYRKSADVSILRIRIKSVKLYTRHWYRL